MSIKETIRNEKEITKQGTKQTKDPICACKNQKNLNLVEFEGKKRDGNPRHNFWIKGTEKYWKHITNDYFQQLKNTNLNRKNKTHITLLELASDLRLGLRSEKKSQNELSKKTQKIYIRMV